ncbi:glycosyltransferase [Nocardioides sp.]|uniref:glycosyltransferase n=1 Tax=Nocardioides sp. TaxID=35761 RepID=UPI00261D1A45|nr:glycosyltransferase [Nocardioides sp.]
MTLLIVTPMHDEADNVAGLVAMLRAQTFTDFAWVVVDDGSTDSTVARLSEVDSTGLARVVSKANDGGLIGGSAYTSWRYGVTAALAERDDYTHVMKLDADVRLQPDYLDLVVPAATGSVGIAGGVIVSAGMAEQKLHVPGPVKLFTRAAYHLAEDLPAAIGNDVMDEVIVAEGGLSTLVLPEARFELSREIGASEGRVHGRYRNGRVCRWTGYDPFYFLFHAARYLGRRPRLIGTVAMLWGYLSAGPGPYPSRLKRAHARMQRTKLRSMLRNPFAFWRRVYHLEGTTMAVEDERPTLHAEGTGNWMISPEVLEFLQRHVTADSVTVETGAGYSTIALSQIGARHTVITPSESEAAAIGAWCADHGISMERTEFRFGYSQDIVPTLDLGETDLVLVDGGHGFPIPVIDYFYLSTALKVGGHLLVDDVDIWTGSMIVDVLKAEPEWAYEGLLNRRTAVFRKVAPVQAREWVDQPTVVAKSRLGRLRRQGLNGLDRLVHGDLDGLRQRVARTQALRRARRG